jgi:hypothetical protein
VPLHPRPAGTTTIIESGDYFVMMTAHAAQPAQRETAGKKASGKKSSRDKDVLDTVAEYSLSGFLEAEPDIYTVSDIKVRYR